MVRHTHGTALPLRRPVVRNLAPRPSSWDRNRSGQSVSARRLSCLGDKKLRPSLGLASLRATRRKRIGEVTCAGMQRENEVTKGVSASASHYDIALFRVSKGAGCARQQLKESPCHKLIAHIITYKCWTNRKRNSAKEFSQDSVSSAALSRVA